MIVASIVLAASVAVLHPPQRAFLPEWGTAGLIVDLGDGAEGVCFQGQGWSACFSLGLFNCTKLCDPKLYVEQEGVTCWWHCRVPLQVRNEFVWAYAGEGDTFNSIREPRVSCVPLRPGIPGDGGCPDAVFVSRPY